MEHERKYDSIWDEEPQDLSYVIRGQRDTVRLSPLDTGLLAKSSEYTIVCLAFIVGIWILYGLGKMYANRRAKKKEVSAILDINSTYKDLVEREETL